jgi:hypothetical protein
MRSSFLNTALLFLFPFLASASPASAEAAFYGDPSRNYLNIHSTACQWQGEHLVVILELASRAPDPRTLAGMGMHWHLSFESNPEGPQTRIERCSLRLDAKGWTPEIAYRGDGGQAAPAQPENGPQVRIENHQKLVWTIPHNLIEGAEGLTVSSDTAAFPKWRPLSGTQPIRHPLPLPASRELR